MECIARRRISRTILAAIAVYFLVYGVYFLLLFRWQLNIIHSGASDRIGLMTNPLSKVYFLFGKALPGAFYFTFIVTENNKFGLIAYALIFGACLLINFSVISAKGRSSASPVPPRSPGSPAQPPFPTSLLECSLSPTSPASPGSSPSPAPEFPFLRFLDPRLVYTIWLIAAFLLIYLPGLIVRENYASNRTLLALDMAVFFWVYTTILELTKNRKPRLSCLHSHRTTVRSLLLV